MRVLAATFVVMSLTASASAQVAHSPQDAHAKPAGPAPAAHSVPAAQTSPDHQPVSEPAGHNQSGQAAHDLAGHAQHEWVSDRSDLTDSADTVGAGVFQLELGVGFDRNQLAHEAENIVSGPMSLMQFGLGSWVVGRRSAGLERLSVGNDRR